MKQRIACALVGATLLAGTAHAEEITASVWFPETHPLTGDGYMELAKTLEEVSGGELTMQVYTGTSLLPPAAHLSGLQDAIVDMTYHAGTYTPSDLPEDNVLASLGIGMNQSMAGMMAVADFYMNDPGMKAMFDRLGVVFLGSYATPQYVMICNTKVTTLDEISGKKIRTPSPVHAAWVESVGGTPVSVPSSEMFNGLEKGQFDCVFNAANDLKSRSLWDVAKHTTLLEVGSYFAGWEYAMRADRWQELSPEHRRLMLDAMPDNLVNIGQKYQESSDVALSESESHDVTIYEPGDDLQASLDEFVANQVEPMALETAENLGAPDAEGLVSRFQETYDKWQGLLEGISNDDAEALSAVLAENLYDTIDESSYGIE
ncbi:C4-dicarboxylate TRAP transporter substrate-binding protein [Roseovarius sp. B08]|uniref:C4-dicarboxylate TRAP transporter substrate-binding protein n=1 Tax=Roseovarius sp. B08 TaxID=3449223 RepID=UPI003EDC9288